MLRRMMPNDHRVHSAERRCAAMTYVDVLSLLPISRQRSPLLMIFAFAQAEFWE